MVEKRKHRRMPLIKQFGEPVNIVINNEIIPGIILNLSAEGLSMLLYKDVSIGTNLCLSIDIPDLKTSPMNGKIVWSIPKGDMYRIGISITSINSLDAKQINRMAIDFTDCENRILLGAPDVCVSKCHYFNICEKPQKINK